MANRGFPGEAQAVAWEDTAEETCTICFHAYHPRPRAPLHLTLLACKGVGEWHRVLLISSVQSTPPVYKKGQAKNPAVAGRAFSRTPNRKSSSSLQKSKWNVHHLISSINATKQTWARTQNSWLQEKQRKTKTSKTLMCSCLTLLAITEGHRGGKLPKRKKNRECLLLFFPGKAPRATGWVYAFQQIDWIFKEKNSRPRRKVNTFINRTLSPHFAT